MPKFVLAPGTTPLDHLTPEKISDLISQLTGLQEKFEKDNYSYDEKWAIYNQLSAYFDTSGGRMEENDRQLVVNNFNESPKEILIPAAEVQKFVVEMKKLLAQLPSPAVNEFAFRFHLGESNGNYAAVCVPMYGQKAVGGVPSSRVNEKEKSFFTSTGTPFFALLFTDGPDAGFCTDDKICADAIANVDKSGKQVAYFTEDVFSAFYDGLTGPYVHMRLEFARTITDNYISLVLSYLDNTGKEVECNTMFGGAQLRGIFFDQGDLIPPPPSDNIIRDTYFPR